MYCHFFSFFFFDRRRVHVHTNGSAALAQSYLPTSCRVTPLSGLCSAKPKPIFHLNLFTLRMPKLFRNLPSVRNKTATCDIWVWTPRLQIAADANKDINGSNKTFSTHQIKQAPKILFGAQRRFSEQPLAKTVINCLIPPLSHSAVSDLQVDNCAQWPMAFTCTACIVMVWGYAPLPPFSPVFAHKKPTKAEELENNASVV